MQGGWISGGMIVLKLFNKIPLTREMFGCKCEILFELAKFTLETKYLIY